VTACMMSPAVTAPPSMKRARISSCWPRAQRSLLAVLMA
jgi:hypothetical protein